MIVIGAGNIGNLLIQSLKTIPVAKVMAIDISKERLKLANELGADITIDAKGEKDILI